MSNRRAVKATLAPAPASSLPGKRLIHVPTPTLKAMPTLLPPVWVCILHANPIHALSVRYRQAVEGRHLEWPQASKREF